MAQDCKLLRSDGDISDHQWSQLPLCWFLLFTVPIIQKIPIQDKAGLPYCRTRTRVCHKRKNSQARVCHHQQRAGEVEEPQKHALNSETFLSLVNLAILKNMSSSTGRINYPMCEMENHPVMFQTTSFWMLIPQNMGIRIMVLTTHPRMMLLAESESSTLALSPGPRVLVNFPAPPSNATQRGKSFTVSWHFSRIRSGSSYDSYDTQLVGGSLTPLKNMKVSFAYYSQDMEKKAMFQTFPNHQPAVFDHSRTGKFLPEPSQWSSQSNSTNSTCSKSDDSDDSKSKSENHWKTKETRPLWGITMMEPFLLHQTEDINRKRHHIKIPLKNCMFQCQWHCFVWTNSFRTVISFL